MSRYFHIPAAMAFIAFSTPSFAQAIRTWVSGVGDDVNPCSRTAPCKTFAGAISKTAAGGEINCLDPGGFGAVTITKSITIDCTGTYGSVLNPGTNGIIVNDVATAAPNTIDVILRGLSINGGGSSSLGLSGIKFLSGRSLVLQDIFVQNEKGTNGIAIQPGGSASFYAENVTVTGSNVGILMQPTGLNGVLKAELRNVRSQNNSSAGLRVDSSGNSSALGTRVLIDKSSFAGNSDGIIVTAVGGTQAIAMVTDSLIAGNNNTGLSAIGASARIRVANSDITINGTGVSIASGAAIFTYGTNRLDGNVTNGAFTSPAINQQ